MNVLGMFKRIINKKPAINQDKCVLFVTFQVRQREIKMAAALKLEGWSVVMIYFNGDLDKNHKKYFDYYCKTKSKFTAYKLAKDLNPRLIHIFSGSVDDCILHFCKEKLCPTVIDLNDIFLPSLMSYCTERFMPTIEVLEQADAFCARDLQLSQAKLDKIYNLPSKKILFSEYCWNQTHSNIRIKDQANIHIVSVGTIALETHGIFDCCYLDLIRKIIRHKVHLHIYPHLSYRGRRKKVLFLNDFRSFLKLEREGPYLHLHQPVSPNILHKTIQKYDFGLLAGGCKEFGQRYTCFRPPYVEKCYSGRISDYIDAGLPVLINDEVKYNAWILKRYGIAVDLKDVLKEDFKEKLLKHKNNQILNKKIDSTRTILSIERNASRLTAFYRDIIS